MALLDNLPNIFPTQEPDYLKGLLGDKYADLQRQSTTSGLINAALTYLTLPKNQNLGTANILARSYLGGLQGAQNIYDTRAKNVMEGLNVARTIRQTEMEGMTELDKLIFNRERLAEKDPTSPYLSAYDQAIAQKGGLYGGSVEGVSYNILLRGSGNTPEAKAFRATPQYAIAYRDAFAPKTVVQTVQDPVTGVTKQVPVQVQQAAPPKNILPPIYEYDGKATPAETTTIAATTTPADTGGNVTSVPSALTQQQATEYKQKIDQATLLSQSINALKDDINKNGMQLFGLGFKGSKQASLYEDALTQIRIAAELGVLNKEDLPRLRKALPDPTDLASYIKGGGTPSAVMGAFEAVEDKNKRQIKFYSTKLNPQQEKPAATGSRLMLDLNAISEELKRRKGGK